ncbi:hypothetical protein BCIN_03g01260 [Botrytis cinerea B05.10]|uniref:D-isomer specific 2-hydroxyacid dehydrogenase catalytic domain-containing protein n=2 Tax=Botryotinia fuckeliana TaxID=40559 RepID=A0A384JB70_BOTFB|nr:hypothetical protein BCIN_03g01260 [Botrytis cinerea B05.10]ATZ47836.1 hypothetical protein BCIN_03g01260 [Botrytis cinerea B05.10]EMR87172.1 putative hydroxyisocaproate protein [Botrytis cinerea BcDW1]
MDLPKVLLIGTIYCASSEWNNLSDIAELIHLKDGDRDTFRNGCHSGHYDGVVVIIRCEDAYKYTGRFDTDLIQSLPESVKFVCAPQVGYDQIEINTCTIKGIAVSNSPAKIGNATAMLPCISCSVLYVDHGFLLRPSGMANGAGMLG